MATQTIIFTAMPRGVSLDGATLPVSVLVSPRLAGAPTLDTFKDWLTWTRHLKTSGLKIEFVCGNQTHSVAIDPAPLQPELWEAIFDAGTHVADFAFSDFSKRLILSYPTRATLALLKSVFQIGGLQLALPDSSGEAANRRLLLGLINGLQVHWNEEEARRWRA